MKEKKIISYAKINLGLNVFKLDQGKPKHRIESIFVLNKDFYNEIQLTKAKKLLIHSKTMNQFEIDSCIKALDYFQKKFHCNVNYKITIDKKIPSQAGLGGSSSIIGTIFKYLIAQNNLKISIDEIKDIAIKIGSDVPFFMSGYDICLVKGYGEIIEPIKCDNIPTFKIIPTPFTINCKDAFKLFDEMQNYNHNDYEYIKQHLNNLSDIELINNLEQPSFLIEPELKRYKTKNTIMTGSGSYFVSYK